MKTSQSKVSVILPVYNAEQYIEKALLSILNQTYVNLEIIVVNDGSTDKTKTIIKELANTDKRIQFISRENKGLVKTLNEAIGHTTGKFIARMDADDVCHVERIAKQVKFFNENPSYGVLGTSCRLIDEKGNLIGQRVVSATHKLIKAGLIFGNQMSHPSVMFNLNVIDKSELYYKEIKLAEDYELWLRLIDRYRFANLSALLVDYRILSTSISGSSFQKQLETSISLVRQHCGLQSANKLTSAAVRKVPFFQFLRALISLNIKNFSRKQFSYSALFYKSLLAVRSYLKSYPRS